MKRLSRLECLRTIERLRAIAVVRLDDAAKLGPVVEALAAGDIGAVEITMTTEGALQAIAALASRFESRVLVGAGSVLDPETARLAILAGARFVIAPTFRQEVVSACHRYDVVAVPGAYTPTEILTAWEAGADIVKVFPAGGLGPGYLRDVRGPLPYVRLMATGGVTADNARELLAAGAFAVGVGGALVDRDAVARGDYARITEEARRLSRAVRDARDAREERGSAR